MPKLQMLKYRTTPGRSWWKVGRADQKPEQSWVKGLILPSEQRLKALFRTRVTTEGELRVEDREWSYCILSIPSGVKKKRREGFLKAVEWEILHPVFA